MELQITNNDPGSVFDIQNSSGWLSGFSIILTPAIVPVQVPALRD